VFFPPAFKNLHLSIDYSRAFI